MGSLSKGYEAFCKEFRLWPYGLCWMVVGGILGSKVGAVLVHGRAITKPVRGGSLGLYTRYTRLIQWPSKSHYNKHDFRRFLQSLASEPTVFSEPTQKDGTLDTSATWQPGAQALWLRRLFLALGPGWQIHSQVEVSGPKKTLNKYCRGLNNYQHHLEVYLSYMIL